MGQGVTHSFWERDGLTAVGELKERPCRILSLEDPTFRDGYLYFSLDPSFKKRKFSKAIIDMDYCDIERGILQLQYDASTPENEALTIIYSKLPRTVRLTGDKEWKKVTFEIPNPTFRNKQNGRSDFRFLVSPPKIAIGAISVRLE